MSDIKRPICQYVCGELEESGTEALRLYLPTNEGYINYTFIHSVNQAKNCNVWRMGPAYHCAEIDGEKTLLTTLRSEWEMAIRLKGSPDFIGGVIHGDEIMTGVQFKLDGKEIAPEELVEQTPFDTLTMEVYSNGFDPSNGTTHVLRHTNLLTADRSGIRTEQTVEWVTDAELVSSYMAMMPPFKKFTSHYHTDQNTLPCPIEAKKMLKTAPIKTLCLTGEEGFSFSMTVEKYLSDGGNNIFSITDNGGGSYNKMYFVLAHGGKAQRGDVWHTTTLYRIHKN